MLETDESIMRSQLQDNQDAEGSYRGGNPPKPMIFNIGDVIKQKRGS